MRKYTAFFVILLITALFPSCIAESQVITINADGSITPSTTSIFQIGGAYFLAKDITQSVWIYKSNITFDGNAHCISGGTLDILNTSNVTVRNLTIMNTYQGISIADSSGVTIINNTVAETGASLPFSETWAISIERGNSSAIVENNFIDNMVGLALLETHDNRIIGNNITNCSSFAFGFYNSSENQIFHNNLVNNSVQYYDWGIGSYPYMQSRNLWDNGFFSGGNYWSDYQTRYPNAAMIGTSGIGNTPYTIDPQNKDRYPLMEPYHTVPAEASNSSTDLPAPSQELSPTTVAVVLGASAAAIVAIVCLAIYFKKRRR